MEWVTGVLVNSGQVLRRHPRNLPLTAKAGQEARLAGEKQIRKVVLPAAGLGTRLRPLTSALPKEMLPVGKRLVIQLVLEECDAAGLDQVLAVISRRKLVLLDALYEEDASLDAQPAGDLRAVRFLAGDLSGTAAASAGGQRGAAAYRRDPGPGAPRSAGPRCAVGARRAAVGHREPRQLS